MSSKQSIQEAIEEATGEPFTWSGSSSTWGGDCSNARVISSREGSKYFLKTVPLRKKNIVRGEATNVQAISATKTIRVPRFITQGETQNEAYLVLEALDMHGRGDEKLMGKQLALMHRNVSEKGFGWEETNAIGETEQPNQWHDNWIDFLREERLGFQIDMAKKQGLKISGSDKLLANLDKFFDDYTPEPSLLHGDLWGGNASYLTDGTPVIFDPASYYGDREADLAMTEMFGGFSREFYKGYNQEWPLHKGYEVRKRLYNLYHELNHYNMFGGGYGSQAKRSVEWLLSQI
mmetsp:Transcript_9433/g.14307  ORF Transcript_9433/g.14307 Transcript_9433/m.14307 type:complete len:291 (-) Transcript_9433:57-929(-)